MTPARWTLQIKYLTLACLLTGGAAVAAEAPVDCVNPPQGQMDLEGPHIRVGDSVWAGPTARVVVKWVDGKTGGPTQQAISQGREELDAFADKRNALPNLKICGDAWEIKPLAFAVDSAAPEITWEVVDLDEFPNERRKARNPKGLSWSGGASWKELKENAEPTVIRTHTPQLLLHGARFHIGDQEIEPEDDQMLWVRFQDIGAGVDHLTFQLRPGKDDKSGKDKGEEMVLAIETVDLVGNGRKAEWGVTEAETR